MLQQVHELVEPLTRYGLDTLAIRQGSAFVAQAVVQVVERVHFESTSTSGSGPAPGSVSRCSSDAHAAQAARDAAAALAAAVPPRLIQWAAGQSLDASLDAGTCHDGLPAYGATSTCRTCSGKGKTTCTNCGGRGKDRCRSCDGNGRARCGACRGGQVTCTSCGGQRGKNVPRGTQGDFTWEQCWGCRGSGTSQCSSCGGAGTKVCMFCSGGSVPCAPCSGSGSVRCQTCAATGHTHMIARVQCTVHRERTMHVPGSDEQVSDELRALSTQQLLSAARTEMREPVVAANTVKRTYDLRVPVRELSLPAAGRTLRLLGIGSNGTIYNFRNVVGELLAHDLDVLQQHTLRHAWFHTAPNDDLERAMEIVLDSEANATILASRGRDASRPELLAQSFRGAVSAEYVLRLQHVFKAAMWRASLAPIGAPVVVACLVATLLGFGVAHALAGRGVWSASWQPLLTGAAIAALAAGVSEWWARKRIGAVFDRPSWGRMVPLLARFRIALAVRGAAGLVFVVVWVGLASLVGVPR